MTLALPSRIHEADGKLVKIEFIQLLYVVIVFHDDRHNVRRMFSMDVFLIEFKRVCGHLPCKVVVFGVYTRVVQRIL